MGLRGHGAIMVADSKMESQPGIKSFFVLFLQQCLTTLASDFVILASLNDVRLYKFLDYIYIFLILMFIVSSVVDQPLLALP